MSDSILKRFLVFQGERYYPRFGWKEFRGSYDDLDVAKRFAENYPKGEFLTDDWWAQVVDTHTGKLISLAGPSALWVDDHGKPPSGNVKVTW